MEQIIEMIKKYKQILVYRHVNPDMDAFGTQFGLILFLRENFPDKNIVAMGEFTSKLLPMYPFDPKTTKYEKEESLGIVVDTANRERVDGDLSLCKEIIKIDHHLIVDQYGDVNIVDDHASSCAQIVANLIAEVRDDYKMPQEAAECLYIGIVGDSNRFLYRNTDERTFRAAAFLAETRIDLEAIYQKMYMKKEKDLAVTKFILNNYHSTSHIAYYILTDEDLKNLGISREEGSDYVNTLANIEEFEIWVAITENRKDHNVRVSLRSREVPVNTVANAFRGGGHALASGATLSSFDELPDLLESLKDAIKSYHNQG